MWRVKVTDKIKKCWRWFPAVTILTILILTLGMPAVMWSQGQNFPTGNGLAFVAATPATCTPGVTASVQLSVAPYQIYYCSATNTWTALGSGSGTISGLTTNCIPKAATATTITGCSSASDNGTTFSTTEPITTTGAITTGSGCTPAGSTATGGVCMTEAASTGWTPTAGFSYMRADTSHAFLYSLNGGGEVPVGLWSATPVGSKCVQSSGVLGLLAEASLACGQLAYPVPVTGGVSGAVPCYTATTTESAGTLLATNALVLGGGAGACPATGNGDFTYAAHTLTGGASGLVNLASEAAGGLIIPSVSQTNLVSTNGALQFDSSNNAFVVGVNGTLGYQAVSSTTRNVASTSCTNQVVTTISATSAPTCTTLTSQFLPGTTFLRVAMTADWTCGTGGTVSSCTAATIVGSTGVPLTITLPSVALSWDWDCDLVVGQATGATANNWNMLTATNGATNVTVSYTQGDSATTFGGGSTTDQASTTTTFNIGGTWTLGGTGTKMPVHVHGRIEGASASGTVVSLQLVAPTVADLVTIYRGASCWVHQ